MRLIVLAIIAVQTAYLSAMPASSHRQCRGQPRRPAPKPSRAGNLTPNATGARSKHSKND